MTGPPAVVLDRYLSELASLDPGLTGKPERALRRGCNCCFDIVSGKADATVLDNARQRFDGGHVTVDAALAARILVVIRESGLLDWYRETDQIGLDQGGWRP